MDGWMWFYKGFWSGGKGGSGRILGWVYVCVNLGSRPSICPRESLLGISSKIPPCVEVEKKMWLWKYLNSKHTHTHSFTHAALLKAGWCQQHSSSTPRNNSSDDDIWHTITWGCQEWLMGRLCIQASNWFHVAPSTDSQNRQADRQAGSANTCKYIKIHGREITAEQRSVRLNTSVQLLQSLEKCCWMHL